MPQSTSQTSKRKIKASEFVKQVKDEIQQELGAAQCLTMDEIHSRRMSEDVKLQSIEYEEKMWARFKIYRRALFAMTLHFEGLRTLLLEIREAYETRLIACRFNVDELLVLKKTHAAREWESDHDMMDNLIQGYIRLSEMETEQFNLLRHIDQQDSQIRNMCEILQRLEQALVEEGKVRREAQTEKAIIVQELNELRVKCTQVSQQSSMMREESGSTNSSYSHLSDALSKDAAKAIASGDVKLLRPVLETIHENLSSLYQQLSVFESDYADTIPRDEYDALLDEKAELNKNQDELLGKLNKLRDKKKSRNQEITNLIEERDAERKLLVQLKTNATPRPSFTDLAKKIKLPPGNDWMTTIEPLTSAQVADLVVETITGKQVNGEPPQIPCLGVGEDIPRLLRYDQDLSDLRLSRRDAVTVIHDIWQRRVSMVRLEAKYQEALNDEYGITSLSDFPEIMPPIRVFSEFVADYFEEKYEKVDERMLWTYNIIECCKRKQTDRKLGEFLFMVEGNMDETVYHLFRGSIARCRDELKRISKSTGKEPGIASVTDFSSVLSQIFPMKTEDDLEKLLKVAGASASLIQYSIPFAMTDEGLYGEFMNEMFRQYNEGRVAFIRDVLEELLRQLGVSWESIDREDDPAGLTDVSLPLFYVCLTIIDPLYPEDKIAEAMAWVFYGISTLPGLGPRGLKLLSYIIAIVDKDESQLDEHDDEDFELALRDLLYNKDEDDSEAWDQMTTAQRTIKLKQMRVVNLKTVVTRMRGSAMLRLNKKEEIRLDDFELTEG